MGRRPTPRRAVAIRPVLFAAALIAAAPLVLCGCTSDPVGVLITRAPTTPSAHDATPAPTPSTPPPTQDPVTATPVTMRCATLVPDSVVHDFGAAYTAVPTAVPAAGSDSARIAALHGTTCEWADPATGHTLDVAVAEPSASDLTALKDDLVERSNSVPTYAEEGYFQIIKKVGMADAFHGKYWIVADSADFFEPGDAVAVVQSVGAALDKRESGPVK